MPHLYDKETGLCEICHKKQIAAIKEGKKYKRQNYDLRKVAIENITSKHDPHYREITDRHYIKHSELDSLGTVEYQEYNSDGTRKTYTRKLPIDNAAIPARKTESLLRERNFDKKYHEDYNGVNYVHIRDDETTPREREKLRKINLANASRYKIYRSSDNVVHLADDHFPQTYVVESHRPYYDDNLNNDQQTVTQQIIYQNPDGTQFYPDSYFAQNNQNSVYPGNGQYVYADSNDPKKKKKVVYYHHYVNEEEEKDES